MTEEIRTAAYDRDLRIEAYRLTGVAQSFPGHFHEYYVLGLMEAGRRALVCKDGTYTLDPGDILRPDPGDSHACTQCGSGTLDYRGINLSREVMGDLTAEVTGTRQLPSFSAPVIRDEEAAPVDIRALREKLYQPEFQDVTAVDFSDLAQGCKTYGEFIENIGKTAESDLQYFGVALCGGKKKINKLTGSLPLLR